VETEEVHLGMTAFLGPIATIGVLRTNVGEMTLIVGTGTETVKDFKKTGHEMEGL